MSSLQAKAKAKPQAPPFHGVTRISETSTSNGIKRHGITEIIDRDPLVAGFGPITEMSHSRTKRRLSAGANRLAVISMQPTRTPVGAAQNGVCSKSIKQWKSLLQPQSTKSTAVLPPAAPSQPLPHVFPSTTPN